MAQFVYIDETGSVGKGAAKQPYFMLVAVIVHEDKVQRLGNAMREVARDHLGSLPYDFEFHGNEIWGGSGCWAGMDPSQLIAVFEDAIDLLDGLDLSLAHSSINKAELHNRYSGGADDNAYLLALQFLLEKVDRLPREYRVIIADEAKEHQLRAIKMVADMQEWGGGEVPGRTLTTVIDSLHFVQSSASYGVQMADLVAYILQRYQRKTEGHPNATAAIKRLHEKVYERMVTWREPWPSPRPDVHSQGFGAY
jgi:hypothetical protein